MPALWPTITWSLIALAGLLAGLAIFCDPPRGRLRCPGGWRRVWGVVPWRVGCWYDMSGAVEGDGGTCPECGRVWKKRAALLRRRVRWRGVVLGVFVAFLAWPASLMPRVERFGAWSVCPTWALVLFAPVDEFCKGALGCPFSWPTMPEATRELMFPKWERPYAAWETAILKGRLEAGVERVRGEFPLRDAVFVNDAKYGREEWWRWSGRRLVAWERATLRTQVGELALMMGVPEESGLQKPRVERAAGLFVMGSTRERVALFSRMLEVADSLGSGESLIEAAGTTSEGESLVLTAHDMASVFPNSLTLTDSGHLAHMHGDPWNLPNPMIELNPDYEGVRRAAWMVSRVDGPPGSPRADTNQNLRMAVFGTVLFTWQPESSASRVAEFLAAIEESAQTGRDTGTPVQTARAGITARVFNMATVAGSGNGDAEPTGPTGRPDGTARRVGLAMRGGEAGALHRAMAVGGLLITIGTDEEHEAAAADIERMRAEIGVRRDPGS